jgi:hypothetical protein
MGEAVDGWHDLAEVMIRPILLSLALAVPFAALQVPIRRQEEIRILVSLPPARQQALVSELQAQPPPTRRAILHTLRQGGVPQPGDGVVEPSPLDLQTPLPEIDLSEFDMRPRAGDMPVIQFEVATSGTVDA